MRNVKSFIASVSIAASTLAFVAVSAPAQALTPGGGFGCTWCGINGGNGVSLNGIKWNGAAMRATQIVDDDQSLRPIGMKLPNGAYISLH